MHTPTHAESRSLDPLVVPGGSTVLGEVLPAVEAALGDGPALLPVPERPAAHRARLVSSLRAGTPVEERADPIAFVVPTSGSEGAPKGVLLGTAAVRAAAEATHARLGGPGRWLLALPATHVAGLMVLVRSVLAGTEPVALDLTGGFDPESFAAASVRLLGGSKDRRYTALVPRQVAAIAEAGRCGMEALAAYDAVLVGGQAIDPELLERVRAAGVNAVSTYGMTETCGGCVYDGVPLDGVKTEVSGDGKIRLAGPVLAQGYRLRPDLTERSFVDGWFRTSDVGHIDAQGRLHVRGRVDDIAISGGVNVALSAVEAAVAGHPLVREAAAVTLPDSRWGERIVVAIVARDRTRIPALDSVRAHVRRQLPTAYAPQQIFVVDRIPTLASGKTDRRALAEQLLPAPR